MNGILITKVCFIEHPNACHVQLKWLIKFSWRLNHCNSFIEDDKSRNVFIIKIDFNHDCKF